MSKFKKALLLTALILIIDQAFKIWIKTHMTLGEEFNVLGTWFKIHFIENPGMAFGMEFGGDWGKIALSIFRIIAVCAILWYMYDISKKKASNAAMISVALILAGAMGNIFDSAFYGIIFDGSLHQVATLFPEGGGYGTFLHGAVVDMLYFPLVQGNYPAWMPYLGGEHFEFFRPVFNIADSAITIGVVLIIIFRKHFNFKKSPYDNETAPVALK
jgi:signal peptidase II